MGPLFFVLMNETIKEKILNLSRPLVEAQGLEIWGLDVQEPPARLVRLFVDIPTATQIENADSGKSPVSPDFGRSERDDWFDDPQLSASIDQCEEISRALGLALEVEDLFPGPWTLEVSTPGLERKFYSLAQMRPYIGDIVEGRLAAPLEADPSRKVYRGRLLSLDDGGFTIEPCSVGEDGEILPENLPPVRLSWNNLRNARRIHIFNVRKKPGKGARKKS